MTETILITGVGRGMRDGYSRFSTSWGSEPETQTQSVQGAATSAQQTLVTDDARQVSAAAAEAGGPDSGNLSESQPSRYGSAFGAEALPSQPPRSSQPWRPGSTTSYPADGLDQTRSPSRGLVPQVAPASYPSTAEGPQRFAPSYR